MLLPVGDDLDEAGVGAKGTADREGQLAIDKIVDRLRGAETAATGGEQCVADLRPHATMPKRRRQRAASAPKPHRDGLRADRHALSPRARFAGVSSADPG